MNSSNDDMKDLLLLRRIRMLSWLQPSHLEIPLNLQSTEVQGLVSRGREGQDQLVCAVLCRIGCVLYRVMEYGC